MSIINHYQSRQTFPWLHYNIKKDITFCCYCVLDKDKILAEHNNDPIYISTGFKNWNKAFKYFESHEDSKRCKEALTSQLTASKCGDITELINKESSKTGTQRTTMLKCCDEMSSVFSKRRDCVSWKPR